MIASSLHSSLSSSEPTLKEGPLARRGNVVGIGIWWKTRHFRLTATELVVTDLKQQSLLARIPCVTLLLCVLLNTRRAPGRRFLVRLTDGSALQLRALTETDAAQWVALINGIIAVAERKRASDRLEWQKQRELGPSLSGSVLSLSGPNSASIKGGNGQSPYPLARVASIPLAGRAQTVSVVPSTSVPSALRSAEHRSGKSVTMAPLIIKHDAMTALTRSNSTGSVKEWAGYREWRQRIASHDVTSTPRSSRHSRGTSQLAMKRRKGVDSDVNEFDEQQHRHYDDFYDNDDSALSTPFSSLSSPSLHPHFPALSKSDSAFNAAIANIMSPITLHSVETPVTRLLFYTLLIYALSSISLLWSYNFRSILQLYSLLTRPSSDMLFHPLQVALQTAISRIPLATLLWSVLYISSLVRESAASSSIRQCSRFDFVGGLTAIVAGTLAVWWCYHHIVIN